MSKGRYNLFGVRNRIYLRKKFELILKQEKDVEIGSFHPFSRYLFSLAKVTLELQMNQMVSLMLQISYLI